MGEWLTWQHNNRHRGYSVMWGSKVPRQPRDTCRRYPSESQTKNLPLPGCPGWGWAWRSSSHTAMLTAAATAIIRVAHGQHWESPIMQHLPLLGSSFRTLQGLSSIFFIHGWTKKCVCPQAEQAYSVASRSTCGPCCPRPSKIVQDNKWRVLTLKKDTKNPTVAQPVKAALPCVWKPQCWCLLAGAVGLFLLN